MPVVPAVVITTAIAVTVVVPVEPPHRRDIGSDATG